jgi:subtilase family serine protease
MRRNSVSVRSIVCSVAALILISSSLSAMHLLGADAQTNLPVALSQQVVPLVHYAQRVQPADANQRLNLSIGLQLRHPNELDSLLGSMYDPQSPYYHRYLTPKQFNQLFAPTSDQVVQVTAFLRSQGLTVTHVSSNNLLINVTATVSQAQQAFHTQINTYRLGSRVFYANAIAPRVPGAISSLIASINGLDDSGQYHPLYQRVPAQFTGHTKQTVSMAGPASGYGPKDLNGAYDAAPLQNSGFLGDRQTIALFELDGYQQSDIEQYFHSYNLGNPSISNVLVDGYNGSAGMNAVEVELDIEIAAALAPHANQLIYEGPNTTQGMNDIYNKIVTDNKAQIVSISWGLCENSSGPAELQTLDNIFKQGAAQGMTFFAAAGDSGAYDCQDTNLAVDSPASDPYVTGVGGTHLQINNGAYGGESVWSNPNSITHGPKGAGGGGGLSNTFKKPSWQSGPGVQNQYSNGYREVPDVTADADPTTGYAIYCTVTNAGCPPTGWLDVGGTSAATPLWAASTALINQYVQSQNEPRIGFANPMLYKLFDTQEQYPAFHDISSGNNLYYPATNNYDLASGMGSPDVYNMARDLLLLDGGIPPPPSPTPSPSPPPSQPLILNGSFESGQSPWQESSAQGYQLISNANPYSGSYSAYLCGYPGCNDSIWQSFTVPVNYTKLTVTYWWFSDTNKTGNQCLDTFASQLQTATNAVIRTLQQSCNTDATNKWVQETFDVSAALAPYKGQAVILSFQGTNAQGWLQTSNFFVDLVMINEV